MLWWLFAFWKKITSLKRIRTKRERDTEIERIIKYFGIYFNSNLIPMWSYKTTSKTNSKRVVIGCILMFCLSFIVFRFVAYSKQRDLKDIQRLIKIFFNKYFFLLFFSCVCLIFLSWFFCLVILFCCWIQNKPLKIAYLWFEVYIFLQFQLYNGREREREKPKVKSMLNN